MKRDHARRRRSSLLGPLAVAIGLLLIPACGGNDVTPPPAPTPPPTPPPPRVVLQNSQSLDIGFAIGEYLTTDRAGTLDATVDYTFANSQIVVWIARGQCTDTQFEAEQCNYAATSFTGAKPRRVSVTGAAAGTYTLIVGNGGPQVEAVSYQVVLTPSASAAAASDGDQAPDARGGYRVRMPRR